jgi:hypothetical protein
VEVELDVETEMDLDTESDFEVEIENVRSDWDAITEAE